MNAIELIRKKRDGKVLTIEEINFLITSFIEEKIPDYPSPNGKSGKRLRRN